MSQKKIVSIADVPRGQGGVIVDLGGGELGRRRLEDLGLRPGKCAVKVSGQPLRGPIVIQVGGTRVAVGHGMARRIMIEV